jgi:hypothetical protein
MNNIEWAHAAAGFRVLEPDEVTELAERSGGDNDAGDWGVMLGSDEACMLYGSPGELRALLLRAHNALPPAPENVGAPPTPRDAHGVRRELRRPGR